MEKSVTATSARVVNEDEATLDDAESILRSPPPDSSSTNSGAPNEGPEDEIVVKSVKGKSTVSNTPGASAAAASVAAASTTATGAAGKGESGEAMDVDDESPAVEGNVVQEPKQRPKRKRASLYDDLAEEKLGRSILDDSIGEPAAPVPPTATPSRTSADGCVNNNNVTNTKGDPRERDSTLKISHW